MKQSTKCGLAVLAAVLILNGAAQASPFSDFKTYASQTLLKPFAKDFGGLLGGSDFNSGHAIGFPGFEVGLSAVVQSKPGKANKILRDSDVKAFGFPLLQAAVALPLVGADFSLRGMSYSSLSVIGGGLRYPVMKSGTLTKFIPDVSVSAFYDAINYTYFKGTHMSFDVSASLAIPVVKPFVGIGYDRTKIETQDMPLLDASATATGTRYTAGLKITPFPLTYVFGAYSVLHGIPGYQAGLGVKF